MQPQAATAVDTLLQRWFAGAASASTTKLKVMASLFGRNTVRERAALIPTDQIAGHIEIVQSWYDGYQHGSLKTDKETSREQGYNQDFFIKILGYTEKKYGEAHTLVPKATTEKRQFPDVLLGYMDDVIGIENVAAVVELKDASTSLDRPQQREGNLSPVQQAFKYKTQYRSCPFVVVSNFYEFRLYNDNQLDYERWTLEDLVDPADDYIKFKTWYVLLCAENFTTPSGTSATEALLTHIRQEQEKIGQRFYDKYKVARDELLRDIWEKNPKTRTQFELAIEKAQTIIDRIVFACFAEDRGLLPDQIIAQVVEYADKSPFNEPLFDHLKGFFRAIDKGSAKLGIPNGYNGGLFAEDQFVDTLTISDHPLRLLTNLGKYDFHENALSVKVLGHIFEQSITDIEDIKQKVFLQQYPIGQQPPPELTEQRGKRKSEGIYYTPDYIVRYIVDNSLGAYLREKEAELQRKHRLTGRLGDIGYEKRERKAYLEYQHVLQTIKVVDPACGSGAFLVSVFDYLLAENMRVDAILGGGLYSTDEYVRSILTNNIFGVDLNEESVEITKLSLWLKTAEKGKALTELDSNIRVGNSVLSDPGVAGKHAFDWEAEFPEVMGRGGFDVVVGNPPWGADIPHEIRGAFRKAYPIVEKQVEIYMAFLARGLALLRDGGHLSFITPSTWLSMHYFKKLRRLILDESEIKTAILITYQVFKDVTAETAIVSLKKGKPADDAMVNYSVARSANDFDRLAFAIADQSDWSDNYKKGFNLKVSGDDSTLIKKLFAGTPLSDFVDVKNGMKPYCQGKGLPIQTKEMVKARLYDSNRKESATFKNYIVGTHIHRFWIEPSNRWIDYGDNLAEPRAFGFEQPKIVMRQTSDRIIAAYDDKNLYNLNNVHNIIARQGVDVDLKAITALLNTRVVDFIYKYLVPEQGRVFAEVKAVKIKMIPLPPLKSLAALRVLHDEIVEAWRNVNKLSDQFKTVLAAEYSITRWPTRSGEWWDWDYAELIGNLRVRLSLKAKADLMEYFKSAQGDVLAAVAVVNELVERLETSVYKAYGLTAKEITIIEAASAAV